MKVWSEEVWRGIVESAPDALVMVDSSGEIVFVSSQVENVFGYRKEELLGQKIEVLLPNRYRTKHVDQRNQYFSTPRIRPMGAGIELFALRKDGREIPVEISLSPVETSDGKLVTAAIRDVSARRKIQEDLKKARENAEAANRSKSEFLANMSHEIRTPLAGILGYAEMIALYCNSDEERKGYMEKIRRCSDSLTELINDILDLSKVEAGALKVEHISMNPMRELEGVLGILESRAVEKHIALQASYERPFPNEIASDPTRFRQVMLNIIGNAIKFTEQGSVSVRAYTDKATNELCFSVTDTGCGLSPEEQGRLFQTFVQADSSTTRKYGGTGLGLALSRRFSRLLGGDLALKESTKGVGSTFELRVPITKVEQRSSDLNTAISPSDGTSEDLRGIRILLAEDNQDNIELTTRFLKEFGAEIDVAINGQEAVEKAQSGQHHVVLLDIQMPILDGYQVVQKLRRMGYRKPVIAITAHAMNDEREKCLASGCSDFLTKPLDIMKLVLAVSKWARQV